MIIQPHCSIRELYNSNRIEVARNRLFERALACTICSLNSAEGNTLLIYKRICALATIYKRSGIVTIRVNNHKALLLNGCNTFCSHIWLIVLILLLKDIDLIYIERRTRISIYTALTLARRNIATEVLCKQTVLTILPSISIICRKWLKSI
jgi:hypothetical protein